MDSEQWAARSIAQTRSKPCGVIDCVQASTGGAREQGTRIDVPDQVAARRAASSPERSLTMTTIQIELPEATAQAASEAGLLTPQALDRLLIDALKRKQAADALVSIADRGLANGIEPMSIEEINLEVKAARSQRRQGAGGH
jgi:hypothetical protein